MSNVKYADVAELADAPDLGSGVYDVQVQVLSSAVNFFPEVLINIALLGFFLSENQYEKRSRTLKCKLLFFLFPINKHHKE